MIAINYVIQLCTIQKDFLQNFTPFMLCQPSSHMVSSGHLSDSKMVFSSKNQIHELDIINQHIKSYQIEESIEKVVFFQSQPMYLTDNHLMIQQIDGQIDFQELTDDALPEETAIVNIFVRLPYLILVSDQTIYIYNSQYSLLGSVSSEANLCSVEVHNGHVGIETYNEDARTYDFRLKNLDNEEIELNIDLQLRASFKKIFLTIDNGLLLLTDEQIQFYDLTTHEITKSFSFTQKLGKLTACRQLNLVTIVLVFNTNLVFFDVVDFKIVAGLRPPLKLFNNYNAVQLERIQDSPILGLQASGKYVYYQQQDINIFLQYQVESHQIEVIYHFRSVGQRFNNLQSFIQFNEHFYVKSYSDMYADVFSHHLNICNAKTLNVLNIKLIYKNKLLYIIQNTQLLKYEDNELVNVFELQIDGDSNFTILDIQIEAGYIYLLAKKQQITYLVKYELRPDNTVTQLGGVTTAGYYLQLHQDRFVLVQQNNKLIIYAQDTLEVVKIIYFQHQLQQLLMHPSELYFVTRSFKTLQLFLIDPGNDVFYECGQMSLPYDADVQMDSYGLFFIQAFNGQMQVKDFIRGNIHYEAEKEGRIVLNDYFFNVNQHGIFMEELDVLSQAQQRVRSQFAADVKEFWAQVEPVKWQTTEK